MIFFNADKRPAPVAGAATTLLLAFALFAVLSATPATAADPATSTPRGLPATPT